MKMTRDEVLATAEMNPEIEEIMDRLGPLRGVGDLGNIEELREAMANFKARRMKKMMASFEGEIPPSTWSEEDRTIPVRDGASIKVRIHKPKSLPEDGCPILVMVHGGGFCLGDLDNETELCRSFVDLGGIAVNVGFRLAPENAFPIPLLDVYDALKWTATHFEELGGNPKKGFITGGVSSGGHLMSIATMLYIEGQHTPSLTGSYLSISPCVPTPLVPAKYKDLCLSREQCKDAPILTMEDLDQMNGHYGLDLSSPLCSPVTFQSLLKNVPPTYFQICGLDPSRDEGLIYERILSEDNGVKTKMDIYPGLPHEFWSWLPQCSFIAKHRIDSVTGLKWLLEQ